MSDFPIDWGDIIPNDLSYLSTQTIFGADGQQRSLSTLSNNFATLSMIAQNRFHWISKTLQPVKRLSEYIEFLLFWFGQCAFVPFEDGWKVQKCCGTGSLGEYGEPTKFTCSDYNGGNQKVYDISEIVWVRNNAMRIPTVILLQKYIDRIAHIERVMDLNIDAQKTPYIIESTPEMQLSVKNVFKQIRQMCEVVFTNMSKGGIRDKIKVLDLNAPYVVDKLYQQKVNEYNDVLNLLGINTIDPKKERLVEFEASITDQLTDNYIDMFLSTRMQALKDFKALGGELQLEVRVKKEENRDQLKTQHEYSYKYPTHTANEETAGD